MLIIRLQRTGTKNKSNFRVVLAQAHHSASKQVVEVLGHYNPRNKQFGIKKQERLDYWIKQNVKISPSVYNLLIEKKILTGKKKQAWRPKKKASAALPQTAPETPKQE